MTNIEHASSTVRTSSSRVPRTIRIRLYALVFLVALLVRAGWGVYRLARCDDPAALEFPDEAQYWQMAASLRAGDGLQDELGFRATRMPLYPAMLSLFAGTVHGVVAAKCFLWVLGSVLAVCSAAMAVALAGSRAGWIAGFLVAFDPFLVFFSSLLLTETVFLPIIVVLWWAARPLLMSVPGGGGAFRWVGVGLLAALAVYVRESSLGLAGALVGFILVCRRFNRRSLAGAMLVAAMVVLALAPWALRNRRVTGHWCWLTYRGGISLYDGVGPQADGSSNLREIKQMPAVRGLGEAEWNHYFMRESLRAIRGDPGRVLRLAGRKLARMWNPVPNVDTYQSRLARFVSAAWTLPLFALAVAGVASLLNTRGRDGLRLVAFLLLPALYLSALHSLFVGSVRYRLGAVPFLEILAAVAIVAMFDRLRQGPAERDQTRGN